MRKVRLPSRLLRLPFFSLYHNAPSQPQDLLDPVTVACALFPRCLPIAQSTQGTESETSRNKKHTSISVHAPIAESCPRSTAYARVVNSQDGSKQFSLVTSNNRGDDQSTGVFCALFERTESTSTIISRIALQGTCSCLDRTSNVSTTGTAAASTSPLEYSRISDGVQISFDGPRHVDSSLCDRVGASENKYIVAFVAKASAAAAGGNAIDNAKDRKLRAHEAALMPQLTHSKEQLEKKWDTSSALTNACLRDELWQRLASRAAVLLPSYSPSGLLQLLALFHHAGAVPRSLLEQVARYLVEGEPYAPPAELFWRMWMANDLVLLCRLLSLCSYRHEPLLHKVVLELRKKHHLLLVSDIAVLFHAIHRLLCSTPLHLNGATVTNLRHAPGRSSAMEPMAAAKSAGADYIGLPYSWTSQQQPSQQQQTPQQGRLQQRHTSRHLEQHLLQAQSQRHQRLERRTHCEQEPVLVEQHQSVKLQAKQQRGEPGQLHNAEHSPIQPREQQHRGRRMQRLSLGPNELRQEEPDAQTGAAREELVTRHTTCSGDVEAVNSFFFSLEELHCFSQCAIIQMSCGRRAAVAVLLRLSHCPGKGASFMMYAKNFCSSSLYAYRLHVSLQRDSRVSLRDSVALLVGALRLARELRVTPSFELLASYVQHIQRRCCCISAAAVSARLLQRAIFALIEVERLALLRLQMSFSSPEVEAASAPASTEQISLVKTLHTLASTSHIGGVAGFRKFCCIENAVADAQTAERFASDAAAAAVDTSDEEQVLLMVETARRTLQHLFAALSTRLDEIGPLRGLDVLDALRLLKVEEAATEKILLSPSSCLALAFQKESNHQNSKHLHHWKTANRLKHPSSPNSVDILQQQQHPPSNDASRSAKESSYLQKSEDFCCNSNVLPSVLEEESCTEELTKQQQQHRMMEERKPASHWGSSFVSWAPRDLCLLKHSASGPSAAALASSDGQARANYLRQPLQPETTAAQLAEGLHWSRTTSEQMGHGRCKRFVVAAALRRITKTDAVAFDTLEGLLCHIGRSLHRLPASHSVTFAAILKDLTFTQHLPPPLGTLPNGCSHFDYKNMQTASSWSSCFPPSSTDFASAAVPLLRDHTLYCTTAQVASFPSTDVGVAGIAIPITSGASISPDAVTAATKQERHRTVFLNKSPQQEKPVPAEEDGRAALSRHKSEVVEMLRENLLEHVERDHHRWTQTELQQLHMLLQ